MALSADTLLGGRVRLAQPVDGYRAGIDPVFLAAAVKAVPGERVLDLGCGAGAASLCLLARLPGLSVCGLELQPELAALARRNADDNGAAASLRIVEGSLLSPPPETGTGFDHVMTNPPWYPPGTVSASPRQQKAVAAIEAEIPLRDWLTAALKRLRPKGRLAVVHRADRLGDILAALQGRTGEVRVWPLWPRRDAPASRVIVTARKQSRTPLELRPGIVLHDAQGGYTPQADAILRHAAPLTPPKA